MEEIMRFDRNADGVVSGFFALNPTPSCSHTLQRPALGLIPELKPALQLWKAAVTDPIHNHANCCHAHSCLRKSWRSLWRSWWRSGPWDR